MNAPLVSVIMPVHNAAPFVEDAVRSVLTQTEADLELIIADDVSTDGSADVVGAINDSRLRLLRSRSPLNAAGARNLAMEEARGTFIAFLDADDFAERNRLAEQIRFLRQTPGATIVASEVALIDEEGARLGRGFPQRSDEEIPATLLFENCLALSSVMARRAALPLFRPGFAPAEDYDMWSRLAPDAGFAILPGRLTRYRVHGGSVSASQPERIRATIAQIHAAQLDRLGFREVPPIHALFAAWPLEVSAAQLAEAEAWLLALLSANERYGAYTRAAFQRVLAARWFSVCLDSWLLGWTVWDIYRRSPLAAPTLARRARLLRRLLPQRLRQR
jgi:glycosyltransferase involved in cell wall biosynthesis